MKKFPISLLGGTAAGLVLSFLLWEYNGTSYEIIGQAGADYQVNEMDFNFVYRTSLLVLVFTFLIYLIWIFIDKKRHEKFIAELNKSKQSRR